jgi:hypothetical protein
MIYGVNRWKEVNAGGSEPQEPTYFKEAFIAGLSLTSSEAASFADIIPLVCLYEIKYPSS